MYLETFKQVLVQIWDAMPQETVRAGLTQIFTKRFDWNL